MSIRIFGIKNCDTVKKALKWLAAENLPHTFHDFRKDGLEPKLLAEMLDAIGADTLINRRGTTWRNLPDEIKNSLTEESTIDLMLENAAIIKRPVWQHNGQFKLGFAAKDRAELEAWLKS